VHPNLFLVVLLILPMAEQPLFTEEHRAVLMRDGVVVVRGVIPDAMCQQLYRDMLHYFQEWNPALVPQNPQAWAGERMPPGVHGMPHLSL
jgi:hypothetical protein